jgi:hypothetical protein
MEVVVDLPILRIAPPAYSVVEVRHHMTSAILRLAIFVKSDRNVPGVLVSGARDERDKHMLSILREGGVSISAITGAADGYKTIALVLVRSPEDLSGHIERSEDQVPCCLVEWVVIDQRYDHSPVIVEMINKAVYVLGLERAVMLIDSPEGTQHFRMMERAGFKRDEEYSTPERQLLRKVVTIS